MVSSTSRSLSSDVKARSTSFSGEDGLLRKRGRPWDGYHCGNIPIKKGHSREISTRMDAMFVALSLFLYEYENQSNSQLSKLAPTDLPWPTTIWMRLQLPLNCAFCALCTASLHEFSPGSIKLSGWQDPLHAPPWSCCQDPVAQTQGSAQGLNLKAGRGAWKLGDGFFLDFSESRDGNGMEWWESILLLRFVRT